MRKKSKEDVLTKHFLSYLDIKKDNQIISHQRLSLKEHFDAHVHHFWIGVETPAHSDLLWEKKVYDILKDFKMFKKGIIAVHGVTLSISLKYIIILISHHDTY